MLERQDELQRHAGSPGASPAFLPAGDTALVVEFGERFERALSERVLRLRHRLREAALPGVVEAVPTIRSLMVHYDPLRTDHATLCTQIRALLADAAQVGAPGRRWHVPACYEATHAPDLESVAAATGLAPAQVIERHSATRFHVYMIGFVPGFPYLGDLPPELVLPRRTDPRTRVPAGSIAIASTMSAVYPVESPGGWHLIGATPIALFNASADRPALFAPGDQVQFEPIGAGAFEDIRRAAAAGEYRVPFEPATP